MHSGFVAAGAYRAGARLVDGRTGVVYDYTRKGGVVHTEIMLPENAPGRYHDRQTLWNAVEQAERQSNAQLSRELRLALGENYHRVRMTLIQCRMTLTFSQSTAGVFRMYPSFM